MLSDNAVLLEYFVGDSSVYVFTLMASELQAFSLKILYCTSRYPAGTNGFGNGCRTTAGVPALL